MPVNLSIKNVPEAMATKLRQRAEQNHRSLQGELMAILENASLEPNVRANTSGARYEIETPPLRPNDGLLDRLLAIAGDRRIDATKRLTRDQAHERQQLRKAGI